MTIGPEMLAAYADGELGPEDVALVEAAIAADPALAAEVAAHRRLRETLAAHYAPMLDAPVPERLTALLRPRDNIVSLAAVRAEREVSSPPPPRAAPRWIMGGALAASLALGLVIGGQWSGPQGPIASQGGRLVAQGTLDKALTTQLASAGQTGPVRILMSFAATDGRYCRGFEAGATAGIACREGERWAIERARASDPVAGTGGYRQAGSAAAEIMAAAQDMAAGPALDDKGERAAQKAGWRR